jgi:glycerol-3-phosphate dehydrogenase (NAD(P)+)
MKVCVLGAGAWGTAIAQVLAENGNDVKLWCREPEVYESIKHTKINECYLPGFPLHATIQPTNDLYEAIKNTEWIFEAIPVKYLRSILEQLKTSVLPEQGFVLLSKGIEQNTLFFPTQIIDDIFGKSTKKIVVAGPSFAQELIKKELTAVSIASQNIEFAKQIQKMLQNNYFKGFITDDIIGVQVGAALKNVIAIGVGILEGAQRGDNAKAFLITRGLKEVNKVAIALGGNQETMYDLAGLGDLVLTCMGKLSKNLMLGRRLGQGESFDAILKTMGTAPEGINTLEAVVEIAQKQHFDVTICQGIYDVVFCRKKIDAFITACLANSL